MSISTILGAQSALDLTGRVSLRSENVHYDENSEILPDSIDADEYGKTTLIPGLRHRLNLALFGRTKNLDLNLLSDLEYNDWNKFNFRRFSLDMRFSNHELMGGDFFESINETFLYSREVRGGRYRLSMDDMFGANSFVRVNVLGGIVQHAISEGDRLPDLYKQIETSGQYKRWMAAGDARFGKTGSYDLAFNYLWGKDQQSSIDTSINEPLANAVYGAIGNLYFWNRHIRLFGEYYQSRKDTLTATNIKDYSYNGGLDLQYNSIKMVILYQRLGYDYFTIGNPYLENDKEGVKGLIGYALSDVFSLNSDFEIYKGNLNKISSFPTTTTWFINVGGTTYVPGWPELTLRYGLRSDLSDTVYDEEENPLKNDQTTEKFEGGLSVGFDDTRFTLSAIQLKLDDKSIISSGTPIGTDQLITSFNIYTTAITNLFFSGGVVYSKLEMTNDQNYDNIYLYGTFRWDIIPRILKLEADLTYIKNESSGADDEDFLSNYDHYFGEISLEYFFSNQVSFKIITGTDNKKYGYSIEKALEIIAEPSYGPMYFNSNESYEAIIIGGEFNWIF
jgi:hypothetical protein